VSGNNYNYKSDLLESLKDLTFAELYLDAAAKESRETFFLALRDVAEAQMGVAQLAENANVNRENLYRILSEEGNPRDRTLDSVLNALGMYTTVKLRQASPIPIGTSGVTNSIVQAAIEAAQEPSNNPTDEPTILDMIQRGSNVMVTVAAEEQINCSSNVLAARSQLALAA
jgi:probable addiction module antidote protein